MKKKIYRLLIIIFIILMIISIINLVSWIVENHKVKNIVNNEKVNIIEKETTYLDKNIIKDNENTVGWIKIDGTKIDYPVVRYINNSYYLDHDFYNNRNSSGWIFMDYRNKLDDQQIIIYGHHRKDGSMFGSLDRILKDKSINEILFITTEGTSKYKIFSVFTTLSDDDIYSRYNGFDMNKKIELLSNRSKIDYNKKIKNSKQIITLYTCHTNDKERWVISGYKKS